MNYEDRDTYGICKRSADCAAGPDLRHGPGPELIHSWAEGIHSYYGTKPH